MVEKEKERMLQERYMELQMIVSQIKQIQQHIEKMEAQLAELKSVGEALDDLKDVKKGTEILVPVSNGIFVKADIKESDRLIINVGSNVAVEKSNTETKEMIGAQVVEIEKYKDHLTMQLQEFERNAVEIEKELQAMVK